MNFVLHNTASNVDMMYSLSVGLGVSLPACVCCTQHQLAQKTLFTTRAIKQQGKKFARKKKIKRKEKLHYGSHPLDTNMANTDFIGGRWLASKKEALTLEL